jgi:hypothetical protein
MPHENFSNNLRIVCDKQISVAHTGDIVNNQFYFSYNADTHISPKGKSLTMQKVRLA